MVAMWPLHACCAVMVWWLSDLHLSSIHEHSHGSDRPVILELSLLHVVTCAVTVWSRFDHFRHCQRGCRDVVAFFMGCHTCGHNQHSHRAVVFIQGLSQMWSRYCHSVGRNHIGAG